MSDETRAPFSLHPDNPEPDGDAELPNGGGTVDDRDWDDLLPCTPPTKGGDFPGDFGSFEQGPGGLYGDERGGQRPKKRS